MKRIHKKIIALSLAFIFACAIGLFQFNRIDNTYYPTIESVEVIAKDIELPTPEFAEQIPLPTPRVSEMRTDTSDTNTIERRQPEASPDSLRTYEVIQEPYQPSDRALEAKFWLDTIGSFLTTVAPFVVPFIIYRKKKEE